MVRISRYFIVCAVGVLWVVNAHSMIVEGVELKETQHPHAAKMMPPFIETFKQDREQWCAFYRNSITEIDVTIGQLFPQGHFEGLEARMMSECIAETLNPDPAHSQKSPIIEKSEALSKEKTVYNDLMGIRDNLEFFLDHISGIDLSKWVKAATEVEDNARCQSPLDPYRFTSSYPDVPYCVKPEFLFFNENMAPYIIWHMNSHRLITQTIMADWLFEFWPEDYRSIQWHYLKSKISHLILLDRILKPLSCVMRSIQDAAAKEHDRLEQDVKKAVDSQRTGDAYETLESPFMVSNTCPSDPEAEDDNLALSSDSEEDNNLASLDGDKTQVSSDSEEEGDDSPQGFHGDGGQAKVQMPTGSEAVLGVDFGGPPVSDTKNG